MGQPLLVVGLRGMLRNVTLWAHRPQGAWQARPERVGHGPHRQGICALLGPQPSRLSPLSPGMPQHLSETGHSSSLWQGTCEGCNCGAGRPNSGAEGCSELQGASQMLRWSRWREVAGWRHRRQRSCYNPPPQGGLSADPGYCLRHQKVGACQGPGTEPALCCSGRPCTAHPGDRRARETVALWRKANSNV